MAVRLNTIHIRSCQKRSRRHKHQSLLERLNNALQILSSKLNRLRKFDISNPYHAWYLKVCLWDINKGQQSHVEHD